jgi:hypothetical protein
MLAPATTIRSVAQLKQYAKNQGPEQADRKQSE